LAPGVGFPENRVILIGGYNIVAGMDIKIDIMIFINRL
jgi:hypothetical protein